ncbi:flagellar rod assembly protein/muramidase FlgJ [Acidihalobacter aeolianus]|uniref:Peptidoglycan hydrolase FlgJ n=2 Tax=Acidihalobacter aeolianus TaxID=2792603 RepID=A0A1D8K6T2_9GAMM|nr:flagellar rod assembly protein/muramidase FlgJ [Acidihalobacter aeolianus]
MTSPLTTDVGSMASTYTDFQGLGQLKAAARANNPQAKAAAIKQFESVFIEMMLKAMRDATPKNPLFDNSQTSLYQNLYDHQLAINLAGHGDLGLGKLIGQSLGGQGVAQGAIPPDSSRSAPAATSAPPPSVAATGEAALPVTWPPATPADFVRAVMPYAKQAAAKIGVAPQVLVAQAALESGWGKRIPQLPDGRSSFNLFGIKAGSDWQGASVAVPTVEFNGGVLQQEKAAFRAYSSLAASFADYAKLITSQPRYQSAVAQASEPSAYLAQLQSAGYATDPAYAEKIQSILGGQHLLAIGAGIKNPANGPLT